MDPGSEIRDPQQIRNTAWKGFEAKPYTYKKMRECAVGFSPVLIPFEFSSFEMSQKPPANFVF